MLSAMLRPVTTLDELEQALLARVPEEFRSDFFKPPAPNQLTESQTGISSDAFKAAAGRIQRAINQKESVVIYGDYDCDGVTATAILWETLFQLGLNARPFLPHRERHGYGLSLAGLKEIWQDSSPTLIVTVDNGIVADEAVAWAKKHGADVIVTDHHEAGDQLPPADHILHSTKLCGASVSWLLANELDPRFAAKQLDLAAIGTIADQVKLYGANRSFAWHGLEALRQTNRASLQALAEVSGLKLAQADSGTVHFGIAPRINAMGRLGDALDALRALVVKNPLRAESLMRQLNQVNTERQDVTAAALERALESLGDQGEQKIIVVSGEFHEGIIGLVASKLVEKTGKPSIVISIGPKIAKASCRSVPGFNIIEFLRSLSDMPFVSLGGHAMAAGFSLQSEDVKMAEIMMQNAGKKSLSDESLLPKSEIFASLDGSLLNRETAKLLQRFAPYGAGNEEPLFLLPQVTIQRTRAVGRDNRHAQIWLEYGGQIHQAIWFSYMERGFQPEQNTADAVVRLTASSFPGRQIELQVQRFQST